MRHDLAIYVRLLGVQLRSQMQYRTSFLMGIAATALVTIFEFGSLALAMQQFAMIDGWSIAEIAFLYGQVEFAFGWMDLLFEGFDPGRFGRRIRLGLLDQLMLRPVGLTWQILGSDLSLRRLGRIVIGAAIFIFAVQQLTISWTLAKIVFVPLVILGMICYFGGLFIIGATITFWTVDSIELMNVLTYGGTQAVSYPMTIYPNWLRRFFTYVVPAIFLNYYPALWILDKPDPFRMPAFAHYVAPLVGAGLLGASLLVWRLGLRQYQSSGT
ncbi:MAG: ABC-2 family transporter protein [Anaerolineales bacterium]|nr:ABC-2 family transporter protein [Anaerolineales bacterium]MCB8960060.1 ABC-2 family transporter protein [Ardenticatenales bacterium]